MKQTEVNQFDELYQRHLRLLIVCNSIGGMCLNLIGNGLIL